MNKEPAAEEVKSKPEPGWLAPTPKGMISVREIGVMIVPSLLGIFVGLCLTAPLVRDRVAPTADPWWQFHWPEFAIYWAAGILVFVVGLTAAFGFGALAIFRTWRRQVDNIGENCQVSGRSTLHQTRHGSNT